MAKEKDDTELRLVITEEEKARVFKECHSATLRKIEERFYWPDYYKDTMEMPVSYKFYSFANAPS